MPYYVDVTSERLSNIREGLTLIEQVDRDAANNLDLYVYGITSDPQIIDAAKEAIADSEELDESDVQVAEVAVAIPLSSDTIYYLTGSGLILRREDFTYQGRQGEGVRTQTFAFSHYHPRVTLNNFSKLAVASSDAWLDDFLKREGSNTPAQITPNVRRTEEATQPGAPAPAATTAPQTPGRTSSLKISELVEKFFLD